MYRLKHMVPSEIILTIYNGLIEPHIIYGYKGWDLNQEIILKMQKKAMRIICSSDYLSASPSLKVIYHPLYGMNNYVLICGDWLSCDPLRGSHDSQSPHLWA